jgi:hypothetical protein
MWSHLRRLPRRILILLGLAALALILLSGRAVVRLAIAGRLRHAAAERGLVASWRRLDLAPPIRVRVLGLTMAQPAGGDTVFHADSIAVAIDPVALLAFAVRPQRVELAHARIAPPGAGAEPAEALAAESAAPRRATAEKVRRTAETVTRMMLAPARQLPELRLRDVELEAPPADDGTPAAAPLLAIQRFDLTHLRDGIRLSGAGSVGLEQVVPFDLALDYAHDDWLAGRMWFGVPDSTRGAPDTLLVRIEGALAQDRRRGELTLRDPTRVWIGALPLTLGGTLARSGPRGSLHVAADDVTASLIERSIPAPLLGPLTRIAVEGSFDYRLDLAVDVARPDSVELAVRVVPHDLAINADGTTLPILGLDEPFTATIHLPHGRTAMRDLSRENPFYRPLEAIDSTLVYAVVANEDGGFFRHRGFNLDAMRGSIAEDLRAGAYRRGAGTITMQLARNLYLGHQRTVSRKAQEVVLAWMLEHLTGLSKQRLLEIYLNVVEWGPGIHGIGEAAKYYFGRDPASFTPAQALFLATLLPAPTKWRYKFDKAGELRPSIKAQMHFIGRAMVGKGWLDPERLPPADLLQVAITGPAQAELAGRSPDSTGLGGAAGAAPGHLAGDRRDSH